MRKHNAFLARMTLADAALGREMAYTQEITDRQLRPLLGARFIPYAERMARGIRL